MSPEGLTAAIDMDGASLLPTAYRVSSGLRTPHAPIVVTCV